jgi:hypothetical protein
MVRERGVVSAVQQAERKDAMQQVIVSRNDKEEVWVKTPTGHLLTECFFVSDHGVNSLKINRLIS